jgi:tRNA 2-(methylsulfanyl)-N6-isopentenyladenosine37 hydroxylase
MLGLLAATDARWADEAMADLDAVLRDHAHCEMKAASHALSLAARHAGHDLGDLGLVRKLTALAKEELDHFERVLAILVARNIPLGTPPVDEYAAALRAGAQRLPKSCPVLVDRLLVCALIEARSCERFKLLVDRMGEAHELHAFYNELFAAEARHFREYTELAAAAWDTERVEKRLTELAKVEAEIVRKRSKSEHRATIHG